MKRDPQGADRRKYARLSTDQVISFAPVNAAENLAVSKNLSPGGIRFEAMGCELDQGDVIRVTFNVADQTVVAVGKVVWATETDPITLDVGLEFIEIDPSALELLQNEAETLTPA